jgi:hypothetical protein
MLTFWIMTKWKEVENLQKMYGERQSVSTDYAQFVLAKVWSGRLTIFGKAQTGKAVRMLRHKSTSNKSSNSCLLATPNILIEPISLAVLNLLSSSDPLFSNITSGPDIAFQLIRSPWHYILIPPQALGH